MASIISNILPTEDLSTRAYMRWDATGVEEVPPNEAEDIQAVAELINEGQRRTWNSTRHGYGGTHARTQGIVKGTFIVPDDLPPHLKQTELFQHGGEYPVACRYSSEPGDPGLDDRIPQPRGFAMKLFNVKGDMFEAGMDTPTQDIEFNSTPAIDLADAKTTKEIIGLRLKHAGNKDELNKHLNARHDAQLQLGRDQVRNTHLESTRQYSQTAYRFGDYVIKYSLVPSTETQKKLYEETVKPEHDEAILQKWLQNFHAHHDAEYLFQVQLLENLSDQPVEYSGAVWDESKYPWQTVAKLVIPQQDSFDYERKRFWEDYARVDPWHGLKSLQPLGSSNRLRRAVYAASSSMRRKLNGVKEVQVKSIDEIPN
ncbi:hypothetical protein CORC01_05047 [Colletotrichum orchidophilum]|uniref:Catalase core domain-containing protein n=1 Tax=Colletotrichum orchidophilum TaxID=1209926 RepID=A0A1G4BDZ9_9PEZI|nr:uncharacterized protein CORC01_05047 [Colletotrichum orchidophilum]OHE99689.1 hypothetical protein CORC01_05047 [Colletotrichum orchidophilum]